ncbi:MAG: hypothetical protein CXZ00_12875 [Acidobacteria bacterium]|nr:MAG: hypothetical protein CXZ00_12875 [Acidobacteriota bacterium]
MAITSFQETAFIQALSSLTLAPDRAPQAYALLSALGEYDFNQLTSLADSHHVVLRALTPLQSIAERSGNHELISRCQARINQEHLRISNAVRHLHEIIEALETSGCRITVMKTLDHWPDLGGDLDLYTTASAKEVCDVMTAQFTARIEPQSWGDSLANKRNFIVPNLPEAIEVHAQRLGQTGEQNALAQRFVSRRVKQSVLGFEFNVPAPEERIIVATMQRMYRHFYFRLCDIVNIATLVESGAVDFAELQRAASLGGIWKGVCSLLRIVSDYVQQYRGTPVVLPSQVLADALLGGEKVYFKARFIRVPIVPQGAQLYFAQIAAAALRGDVEGTLRLSLLPGLASAAAISYKLTGSDKGIW